MHDRGGREAAYAMLSSLGTLVSLRDKLRAALAPTLVMWGDRDRLVLQQAEGISAGLDLLHARMVHEPLSTPAREVKLLNPEAQEIIDRAPAAE